MFGGSVRALKLHLIGHAVIEFFGPFVSVFNFKCFLWELGRRKKVEEEEARERECRFKSNDYPLLNMKPPLLTALSLLLYENLHRCCSVMHTLLFLHWTCYNGSILCHGLWPKAVISIVKETYSLTVAVVFYSSPDSFLAWELTTVKYCSYQCRIKYFMVQLSMWLGIISSRAWSSVFNFVH